MFKYAVKYLKNTFYPLNVPETIHIEDGQMVLVRTEKGEEALKAFIVNSQIEKLWEHTKNKPEAFHVIRTLSQRDLQTLEDIKKEEVQSFFKCQALVQQHKLNMNLVQCRITFDRRKITFYYTAPERVDFRALLKDLTQVFTRVRIDLRHIGVRDETKILGGIGSCGRPLCCATYMPEFIPVSIKMAKEQNLSLNPSKISGVCGRLMCCLKNEQETYEELNSNLPNVGDYVTTPEKLKGEVSSVNVLRQLVKVIVTLDGDEKEIREYPVAELRFKPKRRNDRMNIDDKELKELEELEKKEGKAHINDD